MTYPTTRQVNYDYGSGLAGALSQLTAIKDHDGTTLLSVYLYNGLNRLVFEIFTPVTNAIWLNYYNDYTTTNPGTYTCLDGHGRVLKQYWRYPPAMSFLDKFVYTYDAGSNRTTKAVPMATGKDEKYGYDELSRLIKSERGTLSGGTITNKVRAEEWALGQTGNWGSYKVDANGNGDYTEAGDLSQARTHNGANEIWNSTPADAITETAGQVGSAMVPACERWRRYRHRRRASNRGSGRKPSRG